MTTLVHPVKTDIYNCGQMLYNNLRKDVFEVFQHKNLRDERLYSIWRKMHFRCESESHVHYWNYGGRGIKVCEEWNSFVNFCVWAMSNGYQDDLTLDRIDNDGNYEPSNCRWATEETQMNNKRTNVFLTVNGETHTVAEWGRIMNVDHRLISKRLKRGWTAEKAIQPVKR